MRKVLAVVGASMLLVSAACTSVPGVYSAATGPAGTRVRDLLVGIAEDVRSIFESFAGGIDASQSPLNDPIVLKKAKSDLNSATQKAEALADELVDIQQAPANRGR